VRVVRGVVPIYTYLLEIVNTTSKYLPEVSPFLADSINSLFSEIYATLALLTLPISKYHKHIFPASSFYSLDSELSGSGFCAINGGTEALQPL
jgi:hypothetical protein